MKVHVGSILYDYTRDQPTVEAQGATLGAVLDDLERQYKGLRFRIVDEQGAVRPHIHLFVGQRQTRDLSQRLQADDEVHILAALSGG